MDNFTTEVYIDEKEIAKRVEVLGHAITQDYANEELVVVCILKGALIFCSDLIRQIDLPVSVEYIQVSSYGKGMESTGEVELVMDLTGSIKEKNVLIVEDIVDTGLTLKYLQKIFAARGANSVKIASLLHKPEKLKYDVSIDYLAFEIEDQFVVGYGMDYAERFRELPYIGILNANN